MSIWLLLAAFVLGGITVFVALVYLSNGVSEATDNTIYHCDACGHVFTERTEAREHAITKHTALDKYTWTTVIKEI